MPRPATSSGAFKLISGSLTADEQGDPGQEHEDHPDTPPGLLDNCRALSGQPSGESEPRQDHHHQRRGMPLRQASSDAPRGRALSPGR